MTKSSAPGFKTLLVVIAVLLGLSGPALAKKKKKGHKRGKAPISKKVGADSKSAASDAASVDSSDDDDDDDDTSKSSSAARPVPAASDPGSAGGGSDEGGGGSPTVATRKARPVEEPSTPGGPVALQFGVGGTALFRNTAWNQNYAGLAPYKLSPGPQASAWFEAYPAAFSGDGFLANIGLIGRIDYGLGVSSKTPSGANLNTSFQNFHVGAKLRIPMDALIPYVSVAYGAQKFELGGTANVPPADYKYIRAGLGSRFNLSDTSDLDIGIAYVAVNDPGAALKAAFPKAAAYGVDIGASFGMRFTDTIGLRLGVDFRQYGLALGAPATSANAPAGPVGGGTDRYITAWGGLEVVLGGVGGSTSSSSSEPAAAPKKKAAEGEETEKETEKEPS